MATQYFTGYGNDDFGQATKTKVSWWFDRWDPWQMDGAGGNDTLIGGPKNDTLNGGTGADVLEGGEGDDLYYVDQFSDTIIEDAGEGYDTVYSSSSSYSLSNNVERLILQQNINAYAGYGNNQDNDIIGNLYDNLLYGYDGADVIQGQVGQDQIVAGNGDDYVDGGIGFDTLTGTKGYGDSSYYEQDTLVGGYASDYFVLGSGSYQYYNSNGFNDYATVADFDETEDIVQLPYDASSYGAGFVPSNVGSGAGLYHGNDLVAIFEGHSISSLEQAMDTAAFQYDV